jgi:hypothetical protein
VNAQRSTDQLLTELVRADRALREERNDRASFRFVSPYSRNPRLRHNGFHLTGQHGSLHVDRQEIEELKAAGFIRVDVQKTRMPATAGVKAYTVEQWLIDVTPEGAARVDLLERAVAGGQGGGGAAGPELEWATNVLPVLQAARQAAEAAPPDMGASQDAVNELLGRGAGDETTARVLHELEQAGYIRETLDFDQGIGPTHFVLTEKALQVVAGWPGGGADAAYERLVALLEEQIAEAATPEERSRWERARDALLSVGRDVLVELLAGAAGRAIGL